MNLELTAPKLNNCDGNKCIKLNSKEENTSLVEVSRLNAELEQKKSSEDGAGEAGGAAGFLVWLQG